MWRRVSVGLLLLMWSGTARSQTPDSLPLLLPQPRQLTRQAGQFTITDRTRILVSHRHTEEDAAAVETLLEELRSAGAARVRTLHPTHIPRTADAIILAHIGEERWLDEELARAGLSVEANFSPQGYVLEVTPQRVVVAARSSQGLFYGVQTLRQLIRRGSTLSCPAVRIRDWPAMPWRGWQDDISRGPIPTLAFLKRQIRTLAEYKINLFGLYLEDVFAFPGDPLIGPRGAALTPEEVRELVAYAARYYVTVLPEQETFGHLHKILRYEIYSGLAETPHGAVLTPVQPASFDLIARMLNALLPVFPGPFFHIGADETVELGRGQTRALAEREGLGKVYLDFLSRIGQMVRAHGRRPIFWGDIAMHYPELLGQLPKDMIADSWEYDPRDDYRNYLEPFRAAGLDVFVSPGASNWNRLFPDLDAATQNIVNFIRDGQRAGAIGTLNTSWNDDGETLLGNTWPAALLGAACSWQPEPCSTERFWSAYGWAFFRVEGQDLSQAIQRLAQANRQLREAGLRGALIRDFYLSPFSPAGARYAAAALAAAHDLRLDAEQALETFYRLQPHLQRHADALADMIFAARRLDALGMKIQFTADIHQFYDDAYRHQAERTRVARDLHAISSTNGRLQDLRETVLALQSEYAARWQAQYRPFWLLNVLVRYARLALELQGKVEAIDNALAQYQQTGELPPPEQLGLDPSAFANLPKSD